MNLDPNWRKLLGKSSTDRYQRDVELVLRLFSLYQDWLEYQNPMKEWLNNAMRLNTSFSSAKAKRFLTLFPQTQL
jgi:hypothetical protein